MIPENLKYTSEHEWIRFTDDGNVVFGITHYAQDALGDIVFVELPEVNASISAGDTCGEVESTKSVSDIYAPVTGTVIARNDALADSPDSINTDPYGEGWMLEVRPDGGVDSSAFLDAAGYAVVIEGS